jgi:N-acetylmuramic acid 6-phosphate etherase
MVAQIADCDGAQAARALEEAEGEIKTAVLIALGADKADAEDLLRRCDGNLRRVFSEMATENPGEAAESRGQRGEIKP